MLAILRKLTHKRINPYIKKKDATTRILFFLMSPRMGPSCDMGEPRTDSPEQPYGYADFPENNPHCHFDRRGVLSHTRQS